MNFRTQKKINDTINNIHYRPRMSGMELLILIFTISELIRFGPFIGSASKA